ncbi:MAG: hypothetical protein ABIJ09_20020, partial [Pseudomonadota bacterium]
CVGLPNTVCEDQGDGSHLCLCGSVGACDGSQACVLDETTDAGTGLRCCPAGERNCGGTCVDALSDGQNCGACGTVCSGLGGSACVQGHCGCDPGADAGGVCPAPTGSNPPAVSCESVDGGTAGRCAYTCTPPQASCDQNVLDCEVNTATSEQHCGSCENPARVTTIVDSITLVLANRCVGGVPVCGVDPACNGTSEECYEPAGVGDVNASCVNCYSAASPLCVTKMCCHGLCIDATAENKNQYCGCDPRPDGAGNGTDCRDYTVATSDSQRHGKVCVGSNGLAVSRFGLSAGTCGCNTSGDTQCGSADYTSGGLGSATSLVGLCDTSTHQCQAQSVDACGMVDGVVSAGGTQVATASCNPYLGGLLCEDNDSPIGFGECGCSTHIGDADTACATPISGTDGRLHAVADTCGSGDACACQSASAACDPDGTTPDCCSTGGCKNLATDANNCGSCGARCESCDLVPTSCSDQACGVSAQGLAPGQCACNVGTDEPCAPNGIGGGRECIAGKCVCPDASNTPCPIGSFCLAGTVATGHGRGCCDRMATTGPNRCPQAPGTCSGGTPVLCVNTAVGGTKFICCPAGSPCGISGSNVSCN